MKLEIEKLMNVKKLKFIQMKNAREHKREYNDDYYHNSSRKKANVIKIPKKQHLNHYNFVIMFFQDCENYIALTSRIDFQTNNEKIRWGFALLMNTKK